MFNEWLGWRMRTMLWWKLFLLLLHFASSILCDDATGGDLDFFQTGRAYKERPLRYEPNYCHISWIDWARKILCGTRSGGNNGLKQKLISI